MKKINNIRFVDENGKDLSQGYPITYDIIPISELPKSISNGNLGGIIFFDTVSKNHGVYTFYKTKDKIYIYVVTTKIINTSKSLSSNINAMIDELNAPDDYPYCYFINNPYIGEHLQTNKELLFKAVLNSIIQYCENANIMPDNEWKVNTILLN